MVVAFGLATRRPPRWFPDFVEQRQVVDRWVSARAGQAVTSDETMLDRPARTAGHNLATRLLPPAAVEPWSVLMDALASLIEDPPCSVEPDRWFAGGALQVAEV